MVRSTALLALLLAAALSLPAAGAAEPLCEVPDPPPVCDQEEEFDLKVDSVEVSQATQTRTNGIPLVARKATAVRATIGREGAGASVSGRLHVYVNGVEVTPATGVPPINPFFSVPYWPRRNDEDHTLNFELQAPTAITASTDVDFRVDLDADQYEADTANNSGSANDLTAVERCTPHIYYTRINYTPSGLGLPDPDKVKPGTGDAFVRGILPVDESDPVLYRQVPSLTHSWDPNGDGKLGGESSVFEGVYELNKLLGVLEAQRQLIVSNYIGANYRMFIYGWIAGNPIRAFDTTAGQVVANGAAATGGRVAFGNTQDDLYQRTFAHELLHNFGLRHNDLYPAVDYPFPNPAILYPVAKPGGLDQVGWDVGARLVNNPAGNNEIARVKPVTTAGRDFDVMTTGDATVMPPKPAPRTNEAWISTTNYNYLRNHPTLAGNCSKPLPNRVAVLSGFIAAEGKMTLRPAFRFPWKSQPSQDREGRFVAELTDTNGVTITRRFDALVRPDGEHQEDSNGAFSVMLPVDPSAEIASLRIMDADRTVQFAQMQRSEPPRIKIVSPRPGNALGERTEVQWDIDDPDTPDSELLFEAAYSDDNGQSWIPIGVDIPGADRSFSFDASQLPENSGEGIIRVFVSDGLNTAYDDVSGLTR